MASSIVADEPLVHVAFNWDATHLVAATASGIRVFSCSPSLEHVFSRSGFASPDGSPAGEVTSADLGSSLVAVVFGDTIRYWSEAHGQMTSAADMNTHGAVRAVRHVGSHVVVAGDERAALHEISKDGVVKQIMEVETAPNPLGTCALAQAGGGQGFVLACPSPTIGLVQVWHKGRSAPVDVRVHNYRSVACLELSSDGQLLATADSTGMTVLIFSTADGLTRRKLIIGGARTVINCMAFSQDSKGLAVSNDRAEVHMFIVKVNLTPWTPPAPPDPSCLSPHDIAFMEAHFTAMWSLSEFCLDEGIRYRVVFGQEPNTIFIIGMDGNFYRCQFDQVKGNMKQIERRNVMNMT
ncbi:unnamed protein product [Urochloa decumbens]|uniref:Uncharacterized protein n=1 Tax=Urochloa decumbens TaxID=240449 RepID=A0ABC9G0G0_9POAL